MHFQNPYDPSYHAPDQSRDLKKIALGNIMWRLIVNMYYTELFKKAHISQADKCCILYYFATPVAKWCCFRGGVCVFV